MLPGHPSEGKKVLVPDGPIVIMTGNSLRHERFALRLQQEFGSRVVKWYQIVGSQKKSASFAPSGARTRLSRGKELLKRFLSTSISRFRGETHPFRRLERSLKSQEAEFFQSELEHLRTFQLTPPTVISDPNCLDVVSDVRLIGPAFLCTLGGAIFGRPLLDVVSGVAMNQHEGWCPEYRGVYTTHWALYHRDLDKLGSTVHVLTSGMDSGPILRRSQPCLVPWDTPQTCFLRNVTLGTELICEVVRDGLRDGFVTTFDQPHVGHTYLHRDYIRSTILDVERDFSSGWLQQELDRRRGRC